MNIIIIIIITFTKTNIIDAHAKFALEWQPLIGVNTLTWTSNTTKNYHFPLLTFFFLILIISKLRSLYLLVDIHGGLMFILNLIWMNELCKVNVEKNSSINPKWVTWKVRSQSTKNLKQILIT